MKLKFFLPFFALIFILSCGDDPDDFVPNDDDSIYGTQDDDNSLPDAENSGNGEQNDSENSDTEADTGDDSGTNGDSDNTTTDNETTSDDDAETTPDNDTDTTPDDDTDTTPDDADSTDDSDDPQTDDDADSDTGDNDADTGSGDDDADSGSDTGEEDELEVVLPYNGGTVEKTIKLNTKINKIDVLLLVDVGHTSMSTAHDSLKANKDSLIDGIRAKIPDSAFGLVNFGLFGANVYDLAQPVTTDKNNFKNKIDTIAPKTSGSATDLKQRYHTHALWEAASGEADYEQVAHNVSGTTQYSSINIPAVDCSEQEGTIGGACFRDNSMPVFVMATNSAFNDLTYDNFGEWKVGEKKNKPKAAEKMNEINAKFIGFSLTTLSTSNLPKDLGYISENTDSLTLSNENFVISETSDNWATKIAETVKNLTENIKLDVQAQFKHVDNGYGVENTVQFKKSIYPEAGKTVKAGDTASFDITFENTIHENNDCEPHIFYITVEAAGEGLVLDSRSIKVVVPGKEEGCGSAQ